MLCHASSTLEPSDLPNLGQKVSRVFRNKKQKNHWSSGRVFQVVGFSGLNSPLSSDALNSEC